MSRAWAVIKKVEWPAEGSWTAWGRGKSPAFGDGEFKRGVGNTEGNSHLLQPFTRDLVLRMAANCLWAGGALKFCVVVTHLFL